MSDTRQGVRCNRRAENSLKLCGVVIQSLRRILHSFRKVFSITVGIIVVYSM